MRGVVAAALLLMMVLSGCVAEKKDADTDSTSGTASGSTSASKSGTSTKTASGTGSLAPAAGNHAPTVNITAAPINGTAPLNVTFALSGSDADNDTLHWVLMLPNETIANGTGLPGNHTHAFTDAGNYTVTVSVWDGKVNVTANVTVTVTAAAGAGTGGGAKETDWATINADGTCDAKGEIAIPGAGLYVHERGDPPGTGFAAGDGTWVYEETNGLPGLQIGGPDESDAYIACLNPDTIVF
jgi:hypothetical protein